MKVLASSYHHEIILISLNSKNIDPRVFDANKRIFSKVIVVKNEKGLGYLRLINGNIHNILTNVRQGIFVNILDYYYSAEMRKEIASQISTGEFDVIYVTRQMANYVLNEIKVPKIIQPYDAVFEWHRQIYSNTSGLKQVLYFFSYIFTKIYEKQVYAKFSACLVVTNQDKNLLLSLNNKINCFVLPNGVDINYFSPLIITEDFPSLIFVSDMSGHPSSDNVLYFYNDIFPLVRRIFPHIKLYLVGKNPCKEITDLSSDPHVFVTGYVDDVRPFIAKSSIFIAPMILGTGMKTKVLEALSMGKAVVSTSVGAQGINVTPGENVLIADTATQFADYLITLLNDNEKKRKSMGIKARMLMVQEYSWEKIADQLNCILKKTIEEFSK